MNKLNKILSKYIPDYYSLLTPFNERSWEIGIGNNFIEKSYYRYTFLDVYKYDKDESILYRINLEEHTKFKIFDFVEYKNTDVEIRQNLVRYWETHILKGVLEQDLFNSYIKVSYFIDGKELDYFNIRVADLVEFSQNDDEIVLKNPNWHSEVVQDLIKHD